MNSRTFNEIQEHSRVLEWKNQIQEHSRLSATCANPDYTTDDDEPGIDLFRGACAGKGNVQVAGHVKHFDHGDAFPRMTFR